MIIMISFSHTLILWPLLTGNLTSLQRISDTKKLAHAIRIHRFRHSSAYYTQRNAIARHGWSLLPSVYHLNRLPFHYNLLMNVPRCIAHTVLLKNLDNGASIFLAIRDTNNKIRIYMVQSAQWYIELNNVYRTKRHIEEHRRSLSTEESWSADTYGSRNDQCSQSAYKAAQCWSNIMLFQLMIFV